jgi:hypothetical protein
MKMTPTMGGAYSGSFGGLTFSHNKGGAYCRRRTVPTDPASTYQTTVRAAMSALAQRWVNTLTPAQRAAWDLYAQNVSWIDTLGQTIQLSGINHYIRANSPRVIADSYDAAYDNFGALAVIDIAPSVYDLGLAPSVVSEVVNHGGGPPVTVEVAVTIDPPQAGAIEYFFLSPPVNPSISFWKGPYLLIAATVLGGGGLSSAPLTDTDAPYVFRYPLPVEDQAVFYALRIQQPDGRLSGMVRRGPLLVPAAS